MAKQARRSKATRRTSLSREGFFEPFHIDDAPWQKLPGSTAFKTLGRYGGGSQVGVGLDILKPGHYSNRFHYHLAEEEHVFILKGRAQLILGSRKYVMKERHYCCFPAGQRAGHHLYNHTKNACVFLTIGDNKPEDVAIYPNLGKAMIRATRKMVPLTDAFAKTRRE